MTYVSHAHATLTNGSLAQSALPNAPVVPDPVRTRRLLLPRLPRLVRLTVAWQRRADAHERTWEYHWRGAVPACA